jgi:hypothetical protein
MTVTPVEKVRMTPDPGMICGPVRSGAGRSRTAFTSSVVTGGALAVSIVVDSPVVAVVIRLDAFSASAPAGQVQPVITGSLVAAPYCLALTMLSFSGRNRVTHAVFAWQLSRYCS